MNQKIATFSIAALLALATFTGCGDKEGDATMEADRPDKSAKATEDFTKDIKANMKAVENSTIIKDMKAAQGQAVEIQSDTVDKADEVTESVTEDIKTIEKDMGISEGNTSNPSAPAAPATSTAASNDLGKQLYAKCVACHGPKANLKALGKSEVIAGWPTQKIVESLEGYKAGTLNNHGMAATMKGIVAPLSKTDMEAVAQYISDMK